MHERKSTPPSSEQEPTPIDISERVRTMFENPNQREVMKEGVALRRDIEGIPCVALTLDYTTLDHAKFLKALLQRQPHGANWQFSIRATESQMKEAANVFASGVDWIPVEE